LDEIILAFFSGNDLQDNADWYARQRQGSVDDAVRGSGSLVRRWLRENSRLATFLVIRARKLLGSNCQGAMREEDVASLWPLTEASLDRVRVGAGRRPLTIWYLPSVSEWDDKTWKTLRNRCGMVDDDRHVIRDRVREWASEKAVAFVDATDWLAAQDASRILFPYDPHWNAEGHRIVAEGLATAEQACDHSRRDTATE
jgi:hypothetical protein